MTDLTYTKNGMFTTFYPETPQGKEAWTDMHNQGAPNGRILSIHAKDVLAQLRKAGYGVKRAKPVTVADMDAIFAELEI